ncbi:MAG TPA: HAMP domain-containing sensor histidine kinase, partial [Candidatus Paceibacterota bacterium]|nr:HAMP domain-containing sensor histidine kinase [Candidatus Paceibacterota bacterium]
IITPLILTWVFQKKGVHTRMQRAEAVLAFAILIFLDYVLFWTSSTQVAHISLVYFILVPLMWISLRFGARYTTLSLFITALIAFGGLLWGRMTPPSDMLGLRLFQDETFIDIIAVLFFILVAIEEERKTALRNLKSHIVKLEEAVGMRDDFISIASHELKTPVTTLKIYSQTMERELSQKGQETLAGQVSKMDAQLDKLISLVEDLLNVSRSRLGKLEFRKEIFDLEHCIRETVADIRSTTPQRTIEIDGELSHPVYGDRDRIAQVAVNLVNNALKYSPKTSPVFVRLSDEDGFVKVSVRDFGIGIDEEHHQKIFELFYRVPDAGEKTYPGFGIGLHLSNNIVKRHGGKLHVKSRKGEGSEFSFTLPFAHVRRDERSRAKLQKNKLTS